MKRVFLGERTQVHNIKGSPQRQGVSEWLAAWVVFGKLHRVGIACICDIKHQIKGGVHVGVSIVAHSPALRCGPPKLLCFGHQPWKPKRTKLWLVVVRICNTLWREVEG